MLVRHERGAGRDLRPQEVGAAGPHRGGAMKALTYQGEGDVKVMDVPKPAIKDSRDVLVKVTLGGVCGSDRHILHGHTPMNTGAVLGHEFVGVVEDAGKEVNRFKPGDRVVSSFFTSCGHCPLCRKGWFNQCVDKGTFGHGEYFGSLGGGQAEYVVVPNADHTMEPIPEGMDDEPAIHVVRGGGTISMVGVPSAVQGDFPYLRMWLKSLTFRAGWCNVQMYMRPLLELIAAGRLKPEKIISHRMKLDQAEEAYRIFDAREATKIVLTP